MRAPPPPRKSRSRFITVCILRLRQLCTGYKLKKRWHLHKLHKLQRRGNYVASPISGIRTDDMLNLPTGMQNKSCKQKPLLIAAFPKGCSRSPRVRLLQRNRLSKVLISKRKYKLKYFDAHAFGETANSGIIKEGRVTHRCAHTVGSIKKVTSKNADIKIIFHDRNVIKSLNLPAASQYNPQSPELLEFAPQQSIRIKDYSTLSRRSFTLESPEHMDGKRKRNGREVSYKIGTVQPTVVKKNCYLDLFTTLDGPVSMNESISQEGDSNDNMRIGKPSFKSMIKITKYANATIISYSKLVYSLNTISDKNGNLQKYSIRHILK